MNQKRMILLGRARSWLGLVKVLWVCVSMHSLSGGVNVTTYHNDSYRTGQNLQEMILTHSSVNASTFGKLFAFPVEGQIYGQPLVLTDVDVPGRGLMDVVYVATMRNKVYAFNAQAVNPEDAVPLWRVDFNQANAGVTSVPVQDLIGWVDTAMPDIGILGTPVIDEASGTFYCLVRTREPGGDGYRYPQRLHALNVATGQPKAGSPVEVWGAVIGSGIDSDGVGMVRFNERREHQRAGLALVNGVVYVAWAGVGDVQPYHGWLMGYHAQTLAQAGVLNLSPNGKGSGIWQGGAAPAADSEGNLFFITGNGTYTEGGRDYGDSAVRVTPREGLLAVTDHFTPFNQATLEFQDDDLGSSGALLIPDNAGTTRRLMVFSCKNGHIYVVDRDAMGGFNPDDDSQIIQRLDNATGGVWGMGAYFNGKVYFGSLRDSVKAFALNGNKLNPVPVSKTTQIFGYPGPTPSISANGTNDAILWLIENNRFGSGGAAVLRAFDANNLGRELYHSAQAGDRDTAGGAVRFTVPTVANGKVYVAGWNQLTVYGTNEWTAPPVIIPPGHTFDENVTVSIAPPASGAEVFFTVDGTEPTQASIPYNGPFTFSSSTTVKARAYVPGKPPSPMAVAAYLHRSVVGTGNGLKGDYFSRQTNTFSYPATTTRLDYLISFNWGSQSPATNVYPGQFTVRWTGKIQPQFTELYTFYLKGGGQLDLWIGGQRLLSTFIDEVINEDTATIAMKGGELKELRLDYSMPAGRAGASLSWSSPSTPKAVVPSSQLYASTNTLPDVMLISPVVGQVFKAPASIALRIADPPWQVSRVQYYNGTNLLGETTTIPHVFNWTNVTGGAYRVQAQATDASGVSTSSEFLPVTVNCPDLRAFTSGANLVLAWRADAGRCLVETTTRMEPGTTWTLISPTLKVVNGENQATITTPDTGRFYRLRAALR